MSIKSTLLTLSFLLPIVGLQGRDSTDQIKADYYFTHLAFSKAIPFYEKMLESGKNAHVYGRLGDCYRLTGDINKAANYYAQVVAMNRVNDALRLKFAKVLMQLQHYDSAKKFLIDYAANNPRDRRAANMIEGCKKAPAILASSGSIVPSLLELNTDHSEFAPSLWNGHLVFASDTAVQVQKRQSAWSGASCYNVYAVPCDGNGNCGSDYVLPGTTGKVNIEWHDGPATFNAAGDTMYFTRTRYNNRFLMRGAVANKDSVVVLETMMATDYDASSMKFRTVKPMQFNRMNYSVAYPTISPDGNTFIFSSTMNGNGSDLYMSKRNKKGKWMTPVNLGLNVNTEGEEVFPYLVNDTTLIFASDGHPGLGGLDIYVSAWDKTTGVFLPPSHMNCPVNSSYDDMSMALSADGNGYFSSNRPAALGGDNLYFYSRK
jgi:hypothetical protein